MHEILKNPRQGCDLHGALQTVEAIHGAAPVVHANAGCVYHHYLYDKAGCLAGGNVYGPEIPSTESIEKQIIFGGASRLREEIKNTVKVIDASLYVILGSCESAMVGDDLAAMTREALDISIPAVFYHSAGFRGGAHWGYARVMENIFRQLRAVKKLKDEKIPGLVNILGILPKTDIFYKGDIQEITRILNAAGLEANTYFSPQDGTADLERSSQAEHTLVFSYWGIAAARQLEEQFGIPYTVFEGLPLGIKKTAEFYRRLAGSIKIAEEQSENFLREEDAQDRYYRRSLDDVYFGEGLQKKAALVGDIATVCRISLFLQEILGSAAVATVLTDAYAYGKEEDRPPIPGGFLGDLFHTDDSAEIGQILGNSGAEIILGSALEAQAAEDLKIPHLTVSAPNGGQVPLHKTYAGIRGAWFLLEDYAGAVVRNNAALREEARQILKNSSCF